MAGLVAPLQVLESHVLQSRYRFLHSSNDNRDIVRIVAEYPFSIQFGTRDYNEDTKGFFVRVEVNPSHDEVDQKPGFEALVEVICIFNLAEVWSVIPEVEQESYILFTCLGIVVQFARSSLRELTINSPVGPYQLPTIDLGVLVAASAEMQESKSKRNPKKKQPKASKKTD